MKIIKLDPAKAGELRTRLNNIWDINKEYWYPLYNCVSQDVISFDSSYVEGREKLEYIRTLLQLRGVRNVYEFRENGISNEIIDFSGYDFWLSDPYFWNNECFWFNDNMDWIIYISHEGITTFGGKWLVEELKSTWTNWRDYLKWDTKNK